MSKQYDYLVFIGRFQPFHNGHKEVVAKALALANKVIIMVGSAGKPRSTKNPWLFTERVDMIFKAVEDLPGAKEGIGISPLYDKTYNDQAWVTGVQQIVDANIQSDKISQPKIGIIGHAKDESSYYLKMFPQWTLVEHNMNEIVHATDLRELLFGGKNIRYLQGLLPAPVFAWIDEFTATNDFKALTKEYAHIQKYKKSWEAAPYAPTFVTTDAVVVQSGHILLIQRDAAPGEGLWALPGGFLNPNEKIIDGVMRELREETRLKLPIPVLKGSIKTREVFDDPGRSERGRTITHAYLIELPPGSLPPVKGSDDARRAKWVPISDIREDEMFEDHFHIINFLLGCG